MEALSRTAVLDKLAVIIAKLVADQPVRIAVDGRTASGKTTLANELSDALKAQGNDVIRTSIDGFHRPKIERYARGRYSSEGYYHDARDLPAINSLLLNPLGPKGDRLYRTESFDLENDYPIEQEPQLASPNAILIVDGTFLQRPELRDGWDVTIFVETAESVSEQRGVTRDSERLGGEVSARKLYSERYRPAFDLYESLCAPATIADVIFDNNDLNFPSIVLQNSGKFSFTF